MAHSSSILSVFCLFVSFVFCVAQEFQEASQPTFNISLEGGCLKCGSPCLSAVRGALPGCVAPGLAAGGALAGGDVDLNISEDVFQCVKGIVGAASVCRDCLDSLVCCVTDSCNFCACDCHNLLKFSAPLSSPTRDEHPWLFNPQCHFAYIGTPACKDCDGKRVYESINCDKSLFLHYHDYILDGRWVVTESIDSNDETAVVRNRGDGFDDEECPEKETFGWELRSKKAPGKGKLECA
eukprot:GFUD01073626.1.p1 GENE.GFUD01073626.1~~GFUD01073626.1.p1  ORF type:complete len:238 (+),score=53.26 GFUD01073626.1:99-812(+)